MERRGLEPVAVASLRVSFCHRGQDRKSPCKQGSTGNGMTLEVSKARSLHLFLPNESGTLSQACTPTEQLTPVPLSPQ